MYKIIFVDIDGTLRDSERVIRERTKKAIKLAKKKGIVVVICSGRPQKYAQDVSVECGASEYIISSGGASIDNYYTNENIYCDTIDKNSCLEIAKIAERCGARYTFNIPNGRVMNKIKENMRVEEKVLDTDLGTFLDNNQVLQCVITSEEFSVIEEKKKNVLNLQNVVISNQHKSLINSTAPRVGTIYIDVVNKITSKGNAVKELCKYLDISLTDAISIGDDRNDISMFEVTGRSVAMGNAFDFVKNQATEVTLSNDEDGVAVFIEKLLKEKEQR